jgi:hypothetical protein
MGGIPQPCLQAPSAGERRYEIRIDEVKYWTPSSIMIVVKAKERIWFFENFIEELKELFECEDYPKLISAYKIKSGTYLAFEVGDTVLKW